MEPINIPRKPVESSHIKSVGYDPTSETLVVEFIGEKVWSYKPVTMEQYADMTSANSVGKYFHKNLKTNASITATKIQ